MRVNIVVLKVRSRPFYIKKRVRRVYVVVLRQFSVKQIGPGRHLSRFLQMEGLLSITLSIRYHSAYSHVQSTLLQSEYTDSLLITSSDCTLYSLLLR